MEHEIIVVGTGFSGSIVARKIAEELDYKVTVIEKRNHIGGNMYDETDEHGILIQKYGPHFLNTNKFYIIKYLQQYADLFPHNAKLLSFIDGKHVRLPFNFETVQQIVDCEKTEVLLRKLRESFKERDRVPVLELVNHIDKDISAYGNLLFKKAYRNYTAKMWGVSVDEIDKYVLERVPMAMNYDERYLNKDFQFLPKNGFTEIFQNMLKHENIQVVLNTDALEHITFEEQKIKYDEQEVKCLIFTGAVDELFGLKYGNLPYRSLDIRYKYYSQNSVLPSEIVSYPQADGYTRETEYKKLMFDTGGAKGSVVATEYPIWYQKDALVGNIPYYPVLTEESVRVYEKYLEKAKTYDNLFLCGRLAEFKYYNMDICIEHALTYFKNIKKYLEKAE